MAAVMYEIDGPAIRDSSEYALRCSEQNFRAQLRGRRHSRYRQFFLEPADQAKAELMVTAWFGPLLSPTSFLA